MPKYDLSDVKKVGLIISPETSQRIAELRAHFDTGRDRTPPTSSSVVLLLPRIFRHKDPPTPITSSGPTRRSFSEQ